MGSGYRCIRDMGTGILRAMAGTTGVAVALFLLVVVASCGGDGGDGRAATPTATPAAAGESPATPATPAAARGVRLKRVARFDAPVYLRSPPGDRTRQFVVEQAG